MPADDRAAVVELLWFDLPLCLCPPRLLLPPPDFVGCCDWCGLSGRAVLASSSLAGVAPSSLRYGAFLVDCILICGGLKFDGRLLVDCSSCKHPPIRVRHKGSTLVSL